MKNFNEVHNKLRPVVLGYITKITGDADLAEDLTNESMVKVWKNFDKFDETKASISTWVINIAKNTTYDYWRKKAVNTVSIQASVDEDGNEFFDYPSNETPQSISIATELGEGIQLAIKNLPENYRNVADLFFNQELNYEEISLELDKPIGSIKSSLHRAKKMLQESLLSVNLV